MYSQTLTLRNGVACALFLICLLLPVSPAVSKVSVRSAFVSSKSASHTIEIKNMKFQPSELRVHAGDTIIWINRDMVAHNVTETHSAWASPLIEAGKSWKTVATKSSAYFCTIHSAMTGKITVN